MKKLIPASQPTNSNNYAVELNTLVWESLGRHLHSFSIEISDAGIVLRGACDSFHTKQMAQEIVSKNSSRRIVANDLVVNYFRSSDTPISAASPGNPERPLTDTADTAETMMNPQGFFAKILVLADSSSDSDVAFAHALKIALQSKAFLQIMHVDTGHQADWDDFPSVRAAFERWTVLSEGSSRQSVSDLGLEVSKVMATSSDPVKACLDYLEINEFDLIVLPVHQREGRLRWLGKMISERISYGSKQTTLFLSAGRNGFVSQEKGSVTLKNILIPVVKKPRSESSVEFVQKLICSLDLVAGSVTLLHVGSSETMPFVQHPQSDGWTWNKVRLEGDKTETIVQYAKDIDANLIVMTTDGPDRFLDGVRGTTSERVLRKAHCPVAVIPVESSVE